jgi:RNA polymerase sigma-70 factor (ECF subfamily)
MTPARHEEYVRLLMLHQRDVFRYVVTLVPGLADAQEVMQETALALWRKFDEYDPGRPFVPWAKQFAYFEALRFCRSRSKYMEFLSEELIERLAAERDAREPEFEARRLALRHCLDALSERDRNLLEVRYGGEQSLVKYSEQTGRSIHMLRKTLVHLRRGLLECAMRRLAAGEAS